jgi:hypothetical protein
MGFIYSEIGRLFFFILITIAEIFLAIFLILYGSEALKPFAFFLLFVQIFSVQKIFFYISHMNLFSIR